MQEKERGKNMTAQEIKEALRKTGYIATDDIAYAVSGTVNERIPLVTFSAIE